MTTALVEWDGVARTYGGDAPVDALHPTDLRIDRGELVSITGRSGSGKSTLLHVLGLLDQPTAGSYRFDGRNVGHLSDGDRSAVRGQLVGFVFQAFYLVPYRTAIENAMLGALYQGVPSSERRERAREALAQVGLVHRADFFPRQLSGGEQQRVAIARALVARPRLLLADEPTGNLDSATAEVLLDVFAELHRSGLTIIVVTHDESVAARAPRHLTIRDGRLQ